MSTTLSPPSSPLPNEEDMTVFQSNGLHLELAPFGLEKIHDYEAGGHHPVHLGDLFGDNGRYRVIHKLGSGGFANVWLCRDMEARDTTKYVALKVLMAEISTDDCPELCVNELKSAHNAQQGKNDRADCICLPLDQFKIHGPNGTHLCFVYPVFGPKVSLGLFHASRDPDEILRSISLKIVKSIHFLHSYGICHGDITPSNILQCVSGLDGLIEDEVLRILGRPIQNQVHEGLGEGHDKSIAPQYLVYPVKWQDVDTQYIGEQPCLIDFGEAFKVLQPPEDLGIPGPYRSPELILDKVAGFGSDLWALGCTLFEIRTGRKLFNTFDDEDDAYLDAIVQVLGKLPEPWWSTTWNERKRLYKDETDEHGLAIAAAEPRELTDGPGVGTTQIVHPSVAENARSLLDKLAPGLWYLSDDSRGSDRHRDISQREREAFAHLLSQFLEYDPKHRINTKAALDHEWFKL